VTGNVEGAVPWLASWAGRSGFRYAPEPDERWLRAWEPYATLRVPVRYEHALESTGDVGSLSIARLVVESGASSWIAIAQDGRVESRAALSSDGRSALAEPGDLVSLPRRVTGDRAFDEVFAAFARTDADLAAAANERVRRLALSWRTPVHIELRPGGFVVAPVALGADERSLTWLVRAVHALGERAR
jgi:hypothetical protein